MTPEELQYYILLGLLIVVGISFLLILLRVVLGPKIGDRIVAVNMINTLAVIGLADIAVISGEGYLADVCLIYVSIGFLAVTVLCRVFVQNKKDGEE